MGSYTSVVPQQTRRRSHLHRLKWLLALLYVTLCVCCHIFVYCIAASGQLAVVTFVLTIVLGVVTLSIWIVYLALLNSRRVSWSKPLRTVLLTALFGLTLADLTIPVFDWPMRAAFAVQHERMEELAARVERGYVPTAPVHLGFYTVTRTEVDGDGVVCLWVSAHGSPDCAFAKCKASDVQKHFPSLVAQVTFSTDWRFVEQWD